MNHRLPGSQLLERNAAPMTMTTTTSRSPPSSNQNQRPNQEDAHHHHHRDEASVLLAAAVSIEPLAPLQTDDDAQAERRRSSSISFERHTLSLFEDLAAEIDAEDDDEDSDTEPETDDEDNDSGNPAAVAARPEDEEPQDEDTAANYHPTRQQQGALLDTVQIHRGPSRRVSDLSLDLQDIREAVTELAEGAATRPEDEGPEDVAMHYPRQGAPLLVSTTVQIRRPSRRVSEMSLDLEDIREAVTELEDDDEEPSHGNRSRRSSNSMSIVARAEEEIVAKAVREGKLIVTHDDDDSSETGTSVASAAPQGHYSGSSSGRTSLGRGRGSIRSVLSGGSASTQSSRRSLKFRRATAAATSQTAPAVAVASAYAPRDGGDGVTAATADNAPRGSSSVQDDIMTALRELRCESDDDDDDVVERPLVSETGEKEHNEGPEQGDIDASPARRPLTLEMREASIPLSRGSSATEVVAP